MQQELIEMLEEIMQYVEVWNAHDQSVLDKAEALIEKAKNNAPAVPQGEPVAQVSDLFPSIRTKLCEMGFEPGSPLYTEPPQEPVTLTDEVLNKEVSGALVGNLAPEEAWKAGARFAFAALRAKENKL